MHKLGKGTPGTAATAVDGKAAPAGPSATDKGLPDETETAEAAAGRRARAAKVEKESREMAAEAAMIDSAAHKLRPLAEQVVAHLKLPFVVHPFCITDRSHHSIRRFLVRVNAENRLVPAPCCAFHLSPNEIYADVAKNGMLRLWTTSIWDCPLFVYRDTWAWAIKAFAAGRDDASKSQVWANASSERRLALEMFATMGRMRMPLSPHGLVVLHTDIPWPSELPF